MNTYLKKLTLTAIYIAMFVVLSIYGTLDFYTLKLTIQNLPIYLGAITLGPVCGAAIGFAGMFINQILTYPISVTTLLWVLPQTILGLVCGLVFSKFKISFYSIKFWVIIISMQVGLTIITTVVIFVDSIILGYYTFLYVFGSFIVRIMVSVLVGVLYAVIIPFVLNLVKKIH